MYENTNFSHCKHKQHDFSSINRLSFKPAGLHAEVNAIIILWVTSIIFLDIILHLVYFLKTVLFFYANNVLETGFCPRPQAKTYSVGSNRYSLTRRWIMPKNIILVAIYQLLDLLLLSVCLTNHVEATIWSYLYYSHKHHSCIISKLLVWEGTCIFLKNMFALNWKFC
jgi:hypothetical protein